MATENVKVLKIDTKPAEQSLQDLRKELKETRNVMLNAEEGTDEYNKALLRAAEIQHTLKEQMEEVNASAMDFGQIASNATKAVGGMVAGFQAAKATMNLFGVENETVIKSLEKMQNLMAITQALPALVEGFKGFKRLSTAISTATGATSKFGKALISTGLGALAVALGYVIANFEEISKWLDEVTGQTDFLGEIADNVMGGLNAGWAAVIQSLKAVGNAIVTYVTTPFKSVWDAIQAYTSTNGGFAVKLKAAGKALKEGFVSDWKDVGSDFKQIGVVAADAFQKGYDKNKQRRLAKNIEDGKEEGTAKGKAKAEAEEAAYKKRLKDVDKQEREEMLNLQKRGLNYEEYVKEKEALEEKFAKKRIAELKNTLDTEKELTEQEIADLEKQLIDLQDRLVKKPEETQTDNINAISNETVSTAEGIAAAFKSSVLALNEFSDNPAWGRILQNVATLTANWDELYANMQKIHSDIPKEAQKAYSAYAQIAAVGLSAVANLMNGLASEQDTSNKEGFESAKKYQIAGATMSMLAGISSAWASSMALPFPTNVIIGSLLSAMMLGTGIAQINKIKNTKFNSNGDGSNTSTPNAGAIASVIAPVQYTQDVQGASIEGAIKDSKVYVVESDITDTQNKVEVTENEARY